MPTKGPKIDSEDGEIEEMQERRSGGIERGDEVVGEESTAPVAAMSISTIAFTGSVVWISISVSSMAP